MKQELKGTEEEKMIKELDRAIADCKDKSSSGIIQKNTK